MQKKCHVDVNIILTALGTAKLAESTNHVARIPVQIEVDVRFIPVVDPTLLEIFLSFISTTQLRGYLRKIGRCPFVGVIITCKWLRFKYHSVHVSNS
jgi:hypothetical protein